MAPVIVLKETTIVFGPSGSCILPGVITPSASKMRVDPEVQVIETSR
jgi:hypothetical protein